MPNKPSWLVIHHTASGRDATSLRAVNNYHRDKDWDVSPGKVAKAPISSLGSYVQYHHLITVDGTDHRCAQDSEIRWHVGPNINNSSIAICLAGWFDSGHDRAPSAAQMFTLRKLVSEYSVKYQIPREKIVGHHFFATKSCPGSLFNLNDFLDMTTLFSIKGKPKTDLKLLSRLVGRIIVRPESRGEAYFVTEKGLITVGTSFLDYTRFFLNLRSRKTPHTGISEEDFLKLPLLD